MKPHEISFNSRAELERRIKAFKEECPHATLDQTQINRARARATEIDNDGKLPGERATVRIDNTTFTHAN